MASYLGTGQAALLKHAPKPLERVLLSPITSHILVPIPLTPPPPNWATATAHTMGHAHNLDYSLNSSPPSWLVWEGDDYNLPLEMTPHSSTSPWRVTGWCLGDLGDDIKEAQDELDGIMTRLGESGDDLGPLPHVDSSHSRPDAAPPEMSSSIHSVVSSPLLTHSTTLYTPVQARQSSQGHSFQPSLEDSLPDLTRDSLRDSGTFARSPSEGSELLTPPQGHDPLPRIFQHSGTGEGEHHRAQQESTEATNGLHHGGLESLAKTYPSSVIDEQEQDLQGKEVAPGQAPVQPSPLIAQHTPRPLPYSRPHRADWQAPIHDTMRATYSSPDSFPSGHSLFTPHALGYVLRPVPIQPVQYPASFVYQGDTMPRILRPNSPSPARPQGRGLSLCRQEESSKTDMPLTSSPTTHDEWDETESESATPIARKRRVNVAQGKFTTRDDKAGLLQQIAEEEVASENGPGPILRIPCLPLQRGSYSSRVDDYTMPRHLRPDSDFDELELDEIVLGRRSKSKVVDDDVSQSKNRYVGQFPSRKRNSDDDDDDDDDCYIPGRAKRAKTSTGSRKRGRGTKSLAVSQRPLGVTMQGSLQHETEDPFALKSDAKDAPTPLSSASCKSFVERRLYSNREKQIIFKSWTRQSPLTDKTLDAMVAGLAKAGFTRTKTAIKWQLRNKLGAEFEAIAKTTSQTENNE